jgi:hypothetical protein
MSARQMIDIAAAAGIRLAVEGEKLIAEYHGEIPATIVADLKRHKAEILSLLRTPAKPPPDAPSWWPKKHPAIRREPPFGLDHVPSRFQAAWEALLAQCPPSVAPFVWEAAIYDAALLFGDFGQLLDEYRWRPGDIFDVPQDGKQGGLVWFIKGSPVLALGRQMAQTQDGRIWKAR